VGKGWATSRPYESHLVRKDDQPRKTSVILLNTPVVCRINFILRPIPV
jgi:hypothetical protein